MPLPALAGLISAAGAARNIGAAAGALSGTDPLEKALGKINTALSPVSQAFDKTAGQASQLYGTFYKLKAGFDTVIGSVGLVGKAIEAVQSPALHAVAALSQFQSAVTALGRAVQPFVQLASPGVVTMFTRASNDLSASIGRALIPAMELATKFTRGFADVVFALSGPLQRLGRAFDPLVDLFPRFTTMLSPIVRYTNQLVDLLADLARPLAEITGSALGDILDLMAVSFKGLFATMEPGVRIVAELARASGALLAITGGNNFLRLARGAGAFDDKDSIAGGSVGAAATGAQVGSVQGALNKALESAFSIGTAANPAERSATYLETLVGKTDKILTAATNIATSVENLPKNLADAIKSGAASGVIGPVGDMLASSGAVGDAVDRADEWARSTFGFGFR